MKNKFLTVPYIVWMAIFVVIPLLFVIYFAFTDHQGAFSLSGFSHSAKYFPVMLKSLWLAFLCTVICLVFAYPVAFIFSRMKTRYQQTMILLVMLPMWMNFLLRIYALMMVFENNGLINSIISFLGFQKVQIMNTDTAVLLGMIYNFLPFMILPLYSVMTKIGSHLIEASQDLGCNLFGVFRRVLLPLSIPGIIAGITMVFVPAASTLVIAKRLGDGSLLIGDLIEESFLGMSQNFAVGSALSLILMMIILICIGIMNQFDNDDMEGMLL